MLLSHHHNAGQNHNIKIDNRSFENVAKFRYLRMTVTKKKKKKKKKKKEEEEEEEEEEKEEEEKKIIFPVVLFGCETWSLTLREEHRLRVYENRVLRRIFGPKRDEVIGGWRKLHNEELHNLHCSPDIIRMIKSRRMGWAGHLA
jgi:hypothetical protein